MIKKMFLPLVFGAFFWGQAQAGWGDLFALPETMDVPLSGTWAGEPSEFVHRGVALGQSYSLKPCAARQPGDTSACFGRPKGEFNGTFFVEAIDLPSIGVRELANPMIEFDNSGRVRSVVSTFTIDDLDMVLNGLSQKYGEGQYLGDQTWLFNGRQVRVSKEGNLVFQAWQQKRSEPKPGFAKAYVWPGKNFAVILHSYWVDPDDGKLRMEKQTSLFKGLGKLEVLWLPRVADFQKNESSFDRERIAKKMIEYKVDRRGMANNL